MDAKLRERSISITCKKSFAQPYAQKIKNFIWYLLNSATSVENDSFEGDEEQELTFYFLATDEQYKEVLMELQKRLTIIIEGDYLWNGKIF